MSYSRLENIGFLIANFRTIFVFFKNGIQIQKYNYKLRPAGPVPVPVPVFVHPFPVPVPVLVHPFPVPVPVFNGPVPVMVHPFPVPVPVPVPVVWGLADTSAIAQTNEIA